MANISPNTPELKITLHWLEQSRSQRIIWLLEELHLDYEVKTYKRDPQTTGNTALKEIHPLGKSPTLTIEGEHTNGRLVLAESGMIVEYLCGHFAQGQSLVPDKFPVDVVGSGPKPGQETEEWRRFQHYMHYAEGSLMPLVETWYLTFYCVAYHLLFEGRLVLRTSTQFPADVDAGAVGAHIHTNIVRPQLILHFDFLESQMGDTPYLCGQHLTAADIMMSTPVEIALTKCEVSPNDYPLLASYVQRMYQRPAFTRAMQRIIEIDGQYVGFDEVVRGRPNLGVSTKV